MSKQKKMIKQNKEADKKVDRRIQDIIQKIREDGK